MPERLQKILAEGGFGSRRECETLILEGRVEVDREIVLKLGTRVDPQAQTIRVDGQKLKIAHKKYYAVNKPRGVISTNKDPSGRPRVVDLIPTDQRVYTVGRLDKDSEGLIIVTNDGDLANQLTHPRFGIEKTYLIQVEGHPTREQMDSLVSGVYLAEGFVQIKSYLFKRKQKNTTEIEIVLDEGRNREVRRLLARIGHKVLFLRRVAVGSYLMEGIPFGDHRQLTTEEVQLLSVNPKRKAGKKPKAGQSKVHANQLVKKKVARKKVARKKIEGEKNPSGGGRRKKGVRKTVKKSQNHGSRSTRGAARKKVVKKKTVTRGKKKTVQRGQKKSAARGKARVSKPGKKR
ncbi:MAG: pseudouridine synthase [Planctomycetota bacterium]|nr:pseudouridine synthase [Planctomycetota bacterium]